MGAVKDERAALLHWLAAQRRSALAILDGLSEADAVRSVVPSGWTPLSMAEHLGGGERHWFGLALGGAARPPPPGPGGGGRPWFGRAPGGDAAPTPAVPGEPATLAEAVAGYRAEIERSDALLAG